MRILLGVVMFQLFISSYGSQKRGKMFSLFNIIQFKNEGCYSTSTISSSISDGRRNGTCFTTQECLDRKGAAMGTCASGFGVCCVFLTSSCGSTVKENCTYVRNPGFPSTAADISTCNYNIQKVDPDVSSLRLDFESFNLLAGSSTVEGTGFECQDIFKVVGLGTAQRIPTICGANNGQHVYVDLGTNPGDSATLAFAFGPGTVGNRFWEIKVTQILVTSEVRPPAGCLQYFSGSSEGKFQSFNFDGANGHLVDQNYAICIRQELGYCCAKYQPCKVSDSFSLDTNGATSIGTALVDSSCSGDFIEIEGSSGNCGLQNVSNRYCGTVLGDNNRAKLLSTSICDCTAPFVVQIRTDNKGDADSSRTSRGVCLTYWQIPCGF